MRLAALHRRIVQSVNVRIRNGECTERRLARLAGLSQPHVHNVLKGVRELSVDVADRMMECLGMSLLDLFEPEEWAVLARAAQRRRRD
jgi:transcriptional regulator with XRE-family HTH domain